MRYCSVLHLVHAEEVTLAAESSWPPFAKKDGSGISKTIIEKAYSLFRSHC